MEGGDDYDDTPAHPIIMIPENHSTTSKLTKLETTTADPVLTASKLRSYSLYANHRGLSWVFDEPADLSAFLSKYP